MSQNKEQLHRADKVGTGKKVYGELVKKATLFSHPGDKAKYVIVDDEGIEHLVRTDSIELLEIEVLEKYSKA